MKKDTDNNLNARGVQFNIGDCVLVKQKRLNKTITPYDSAHFTISAVKGTMKTTSRPYKTFTRNISFFKKWRGNNQIENREQSKNRKQIKQFTKTPFADPIKRNRVSVVIFIKQSTQTQSLQEQDNNDHTDQAANLEFEDNYLPSIEPLLEDTAQEENVESISSAETYNNFEDNFDCVQQTKATRHLNRY